MELGALFLQVEEHAPADALHAPGDPLVENFAHAHHARIAGNEDVEVAGKAVAQRREPEELLHDLLGVRAALEVDGELQAAEVGLVAHVGHFAQLARLDELGHFIDNGLHGRGIRDLIDLDDVLLRQVPPAGAHLHAAATGAVDPGHLVPVVQNLAAGRKIRRRERREQVMVRVLEVGDRRAADLLEVEAADLAGHANGDAEVCRHEHIGKARRQQGRLFHGAVVVINEIDGVAVNVAEELGADGRELRLRVTRGGVGHVARKHLAEVALGVHKRRQQRAVALRETDHGLVDRSVAVRVEAHGLADDVGRFRAPAREQIHLVHRVQQLAVAGLEAVDLRDRARDNDAHRIRHIVLLQRLGDGLGDDLRLEPDDVGVHGFLDFRCFFSRHNVTVPLRRFFSGNIGQIEKLAAALGNVRLAPGEIVA